MSSCSKYHLSDISDLQIHSKTSLGSSIISELRNVPNGRDNMADSPQFQCKNHYNETLSVYNDTGDGIHLKVTDLYVRDQSNFNNSPNKNLDINNSIQNLTQKLTALSDRLRNVEHCILKSKSKHTAPKAANVKIGSDHNIESIKSLYDKQNFTFLSKIANSVKNFQNSRQESKSKASLASKNDKINRCSFWTSPQVYTLQSKMSDNLCPSKCRNKSFCSLDFTTPNKPKSSVSSRDKSDIEKSYPYEADAFLAKSERQGGSVPSTGMAYETLAYVLEMLTDRTDTLLKRVMKLEGNINKSNEQHQEYIQATQVNCETVFEEVRKQKEEIRDMMNLLKNCSMSYKSLTTDFSQLQSRLSVMSGNIQKILFKTDQPETKHPSSSGVKMFRDSVKLDRAKNSSNRSSRHIWNSEKKSKEITTSFIEDDVMASTPLKVEPSKQGGGIVKPSVTGSQLLSDLTVDNQECECQTNENSLVDNSYIPNKIKRTVRCCDQKECHSASPWISTDLTSLSEFSLDMCTSCTNTTDCENYMLLDKRKLIKKKQPQKSPKISNALLASAASNKTTYVFCKCMGGAVAVTRPPRPSQPPQPPVTQRSQSVQVSSLTLGRNLTRSEPEVTQIGCTRSVCPINDTSVVPKAPSRSVHVTKESKVTQTKEKKKRPSCLCCAKKQKSEDSMEYMIQGKSAAGDYKRDTEPDMVTVPATKSDKCVQVHQCGNYSRT